MMKRLTIITALLLAVSPMIWGQGKPSGPGLKKGDDKSGSAVLDTVFTLTDYNAELSDGTDVLKQDVSVKPVKKFHSTHMIGIRYGVNLASAKFTPDIRPTSVWCPNNYGIVYTYYNDLWDMMDNFGMQAIARLDREGFDSEIIGGTRYTVAELELMTNLRFNIKSFRIIANVGPYAGYRLSNDRTDSEWFYYDNRFDYGLIFGGGVGLMFGPFEFQLETNYKWGLSSYYHTYYYHDEYWMFGYPRVFMFSGTLYYKF